MLSDVERDLFVSRDFDDPQPAVRDKIGATIYKLTSLGGQPTQHPKPARSALGMRRKYTTHYRTFSFCQRIFLPFSVPCAAQRDRSPSLQTFRTAAYYFRPMSQLNSHLSISTACPIPTGICKRSIAFCLSLALRPYRPTTAATS